MAFTPMIWTGFEDGNGMARWSASTGSGAGSTSQAHTGTYSLYFSNAATLWIPLTTAQADLYVSAWFRTVNVSFSCYFYTGSDYVRVYVSSDVFNVSRNTTVIATGTTILSAANWYHVQIRVTIGNSGAVRVLLDGNEEINFSGDTMQNAESTITNVRFSCTNTGTKYYLDDVAIGTDGYPGDVRVDALLPTSDAATEQWTRSTGSDSYALVDEVPASDTDYIYTSTDAQITELGMADFTATDKTILGVSVTAKAKKDSGSNADQLKLGVDSGGTDGMTAFNLTTSYLYYTHYAATNPAGGAWDDTAVDAVLAHIESEIV